MGIVSRAETGLLALSSIGALFHFDNVGIFQDFEPVTPRRQEDDVAGAEFQ